MSAGWKGLDAPIHMSRSSEVYKGSSADKFSNFGHNDAYASTTPMDDAGRGDGTTMRSMSEQLKGFFGEVKWDRRQLVQDEHYQKENHDYPEAFSQLWGGKNDMVPDRNGHLEKVMIEKTIATQNLYLTLMAPWVQHEAINFTWNKTMFTEGMLDQLPEESVPRMLTSTFTSGRASMLRYGICLLVEATFAETPRGRQTFIMNIEQMRVACVNTASLGVMVSLMEHPPFVDPWKTSQVQNAKNFDQIDEDIQKECDDWALVQKSAHGYQDVISAMSKVLTNRGKRATLTMMPQGSGAHQAQMAMQNKFFVTGHATPRDVQTALAKNHVTCESHEFNMGAGERGFDPIFRHRTIGAFVTLDDSGSVDDDVGKHLTKQMDSMIFDQSRGMYVMAAYASVYQYTGVWDFNVRGAPITDVLGVGVMNALGVYTYGQAYNRCTARGTERAVEKIFRLPVHQRQAFFDSLYLLNKNSELVDLKGELYPRASDYSATTFERMITGDEPRDEDRPTLVSVAEHREYARSAGSYTVTDMDMRRSYERRLERSNKRTRENQEDGGADYYNKTDEELFEGNPDMEVDPSEIQQVAGRYLRVDANHVAFVPGTNGVQVRKIRRRGDGASSAAEAFNARINIAKLSASTEDVADTNAEVRAVLKQYTAAIRALTATDDKKAVLLSELARVAKGVIYTIRFGERDAQINAKRDLIEKDDTLITQEEKLAAYTEAVEDIRDALGANGNNVAVNDFKSALIGGFASFLARSELRICIDGITGKRTPLEEACKDASVDLENTAFESKVINPYWWSVDGDAASKEDGQVRLAMFAPGKSAAIPSDGFAATLAATHDVIFDIDVDTATKLVTSFTPAIDTSTVSVARARVDALYWSIALSSLNTVLVDAIARGTELDDVTINGYGTMITANKSAEARLRRHAVTVATGDSSRPLVSQVHMDDRITALTSILKQSLNIPNPLTTTKAFEMYAKELEECETLVTAVTEYTYVSPPVIDVDAILAGKGRRMGTGKDSDDVRAQPANTIANHPWSRAYINECLMRASIAYGDLYKFLVDHDIPLFFCLRGWRPNKCFRMGSALSMEGGVGGAAQTCYKNPNMMTAGNAAQKMVCFRAGCVEWRGPIRESEANLIACFVARSFDVFQIFGHFTLYFKTIVFNPESADIRYAGGQVGGEFACVCFANLIRACSLSLSGAWSSCATSSAPATWAATGASRGTRSATRT